MLSLVHCGLGGRQGGDLVRLGCWNWFWDMESLVSDAIPTRYSRAHINRVWVLKPASSRGVDFFSLLELFWVTGGGQVCTY